jgi:hypothetical protein
MLRRGADSPSRLARNRQSEGRGRLKYCTHPPIKRSGDTKKVRAFIKSKLTLEIVLLLGQRVQQQLK